MSQPEAFLGERAVFRLRLGTFCRMLRLAQTKKLTLSQRNALVRGSTAEHELAVSSGLRNGALKSSFLLFRKR